MTPVRFIALVAGLTVSGACAHSEVLRLDDVVRPATDPSSILLLGKEPERPYTVVGLVSASPNWPSGLGTARKRLQKEAARLGGNALLFDSESLATEEGGGTRLSAKVIVFEQPPAAKPPK